MKVIMVRPGERIYGRDFVVVSRNETIMVLKTQEEPIVILEIRAVDNHTSLHNDPLLGPPLVDICEMEMSETDLAKTMRQRHPRSVVSHYKAYFYDLEQIIFLLLV